MPPRHTGILAHPVVLFELGSRTELRKDSNPNE